MPIYEYVCRKCGNELEKLQKMSDEPLTDCPRCGEAALKRKVSAAAFRLVGGGWYETDFKSDHRHNIAGGRPDGSTAANAGGGGGKKEATSSGDAGKQAKPDSKAATGS